jgi:TRAP-type mannitol/chloroaromatic compound transport system substrate-binding protein
VDARRRQGSAQRILQELQLHRAAGGQYGVPDGRLVPQGDQHCRRSQGHQDACRRIPWTRSAKLGAIPQQIAAGDIYPALEKGTIDAAEWVGPYDDEKLGFYKVAPHYYYPGWWEGGSMLFAFINLDKWNALPKNYQAVLEQAGHFANTWCMAKYDQQNPQALRRLLAGGAKLHGFSPAIMEACFKAANELHGEIAAQNANFKKVMTSLNEFTKNGYQWFQVAELGYDSFMVQHSRG